MSDREIARSIANVKATMAVEGLRVHKRSVTYCERYAKGLMSSKDIMNDIRQYISSKQKGKS